jgi:hypothetical protein
VTQHPFTQRWRTTSASVAVLTLTTEYTRLLGITQPSLPSTTMFRGSDVTMRTWSPGLN